MALETAREKSRSTGVTSGVVTPPLQGASTTVWVIRAIGLSLILVIWELAVRLGLVEEFFLSAPTAVVAALFELAVDSTFYGHLGTTMLELVIGFALGVIVGVPVGIVTGINRVIWHAMEPFVMALYSVPAVAFLPLLVLWFGTGLTQKVLLVFVGVVFPVLINTQSGAANVDAQLIETSRSFWASRYKTTRTVILPGSVPAIFSGLRIAVGRGLIMAVVAEFFGAAKGVGYLIFRAGTSYQTATLLAGTIVLAITAVALTALVNFTERQVAPWRYLADSSA